MIGTRLYEYPPETKPSREEEYHNAKTEFNQKREARKFLNRIYVKEKGYMSNDYLSQFIANKREHERKTSDL